MRTKYATPVERIMASLEESSEAENYSASEIEVMPIAEIKTRLEELGIESSLPPHIERLVSGHVSPSQKVVDALSVHQDAQDDEIERMPLEQVRVKLNNAGVNHIAGLERVRALVGAEASADNAADPSPPAPRENVVPLVRRRPCATLKAAWAKVGQMTIAAAVALLICGLGYHNIRLQEENGELKHQYADLQQGPVLTQLILDVRSNIWDAKTGGEARLWTSGRVESANFSSTASDAALYTQAVLGTNLEPGLGCLDAKVATWSRNPISFTRIKDPVEKSSAGAGTTKSPTPSPPPRSTPQE